MGAFDDIGAISPQQIWDGVLGRAVDGERITFAVVELDPGADVPEHSHEHEQLGIVLSGSVSFRIDAETRELRPGGTWCISSGTPHAVVAGPEGAVVIDVFAPVRGDWAGLEELEARRPRWP